MMLRAWYEDHYHTIRLENDRHVLRGHFTLSDGGCCCVVAVVNPGIDWGAYIGAAPRDLREDEALRYVARNGCKLCPEDAAHFFPELWRHDWWREGYRQ